MNTSYLKFILKRYTDLNLEKMGVSKYSNNTLNTLPRDKRLCMGWRGVFSRGERLELRSNTEKLDLNLFDTGDTIYTIFSIASSADKVGRHLMTSYFFLSIQKIISSRFCSYSEAYASEFPENLEEM